MIMPSKSIYKSPDKISDGLFLSGFFEARHKDILKEQGITHILVAGKGLCIVHPDVSITKDRILNIRSLKFMMIVTSL